MLDQAEIGNPELNNPQKTPETEIEDVLEINLSNLSKNQKTSLYLILIVFLIDSTIMIEVRFITDLFKIFLKGPHVIITDFVGSFFSTLSPYLFVILCFLLIYQGYIVLVNDPEVIKNFSDMFEVISLSVLGMLTIVLLFGMLNIPSYVEFTIFIFLLLLLTSFYFLPCYYLKKANNRFL